MKTGWSITSVKANYVAIWPTKPQCFGQHHGNLEQLVEVGQCQWFFHFCGTWQGDSPRQNERCCLFFGLDWGTWCADIHTPRWWTHARAIQPRTLSLRFARDGCQFYRKIHVGWSNFSGSGTRFFHCIVSRDSTIEKFFSVGVLRNGIPKEIFCNISDIFERCNGIQSRLREGISIFLF